MLRLQAFLPELLKYYPATQSSICASLERWLDLPADHLVAANGSTELISWIDQLFVHGGLATPVPTFGRWTDQPAANGKPVHAFPRVADNDFRLDVAEYVEFVRHAKARVAVICNPNNPTGAFLPRTEVLNLLEQLADLDLVVVDESFIDFVSDGTIPTVARDAMRFRNAVVVKSLGKNLGLHGLRLGYAVGNRRLIQRLRNALPFWNVNGIAEWVIRELPAHRDRYDASRRRVVADRIQARSALREVPGLRLFPSLGNFLFVELPATCDGMAVRDQLLFEFGMLVRACGNKAGGSDQWFRIAIRSPAEMAELAGALTACGLTEPHRWQPRPERVYRYPLSANAG